MPKPVCAIVLALALSLAAIPGAIFVNPSWVDAAAVRGTGVRAQGTESEVPPGNPVVGSERQIDDSQDRTSYVLLSILAACLIGAGALLVKVERWEKARSSSG